jgi:hypothetical protein
MDALYPSIRRLTRSKTWPYHFAVISSGESSPLTEELYVTVPGRFGDRFLRPCCFTGSVLAD